MLFPAVNPDGAAEQAGEEADDCGANEPLPDQE